MTIPSKAKGDGMSWNFDISTAPRETPTKRHGTTNTGKAITYDASEYTPLILATKCGKVTRSYWIEKEQRWAGLSKGEKPVAWMPWPDHPHASKPVEVTE